jgi:hypothetical protein
VTIDIDRSPSLARQLGVQSVPTFVVFHQGRPAGVAWRTEAQGAPGKCQPCLPRDEGGEAESSGALLAASVFDRARPPPSRHIPARPACPSRKSKGDSPSS